jgi:D-alanyl-D-alanine carboxypeptidase
MEGDPPFVRYGQGLVFLGDWCGHNGTIFGFSSEMFYLPQEEAVILVDVNRLDLDDQSKSTNIFLGVSKIPSRSTSTGKVGNGRRTPTLLYCLIHRSA